MKIPYGIADFAEIRRGKNFYVDKTPFLPLLERAGYNLVFLRPRRMGKSSLISMMAHYYDMGRADQFDELFGGLWIHEHPTPEKNAYVVLHLNFGQVTGEDDRAVKVAYAQVVRKALDTKLSYLLSRSERLRQHVGSLDTQTDPIGMVSDAMGILQGMGLRMYIMIDEYDTFANSLLAAGNRDLYESLTEKTGFVRSFYRMLKAGVDTGGIGRTFITGVAPLLLDDLYTGFNITSSITLDPHFRQLAGFTHKDVERATDEFIASNPDIVADARLGNRAELLETLEQHYDGYRLSRRSAERTFNADMVLYFFRQLEMYGAFPEQMLDPNARTDYKKFYGLFEASGQPAQDRRNVLETVLNEGAISGKLLETFGRTPSPPPREQFISLLFYTGMLTLSAKPPVGWVNYFEIPNLVIRNMQWEHFEAILKETSGIELTVPEIAETQLEMAVRGDIMPYLQAVYEHVMKVLSSRDMTDFGERALKMILITSAVMSGIFHVLSEKEAKQGFSDLFLTPRFDAWDAKYSWMMELKYVKAKATEASIEKEFADAHEQLQRYMADTTLIPLLTKKHEMKAVTIVFVGAKEIRCRSWPYEPGQEWRVGEKKAAVKKKTAAKKVAKKTATKKTMTSKAKR